jgi:hypothetical protein
MDRHYHFRIEGTASTEQYQYPREVRSQTLNIPTRDDRSSHGAKLRQDLTNAATQANQQGLPPEREGISLEFSGEPGFDLAFDSLDPKASQGIELSNVRRGPNNIAATVYVPPGKLDHFFRLIDRCSKSVQDQARAPRGQKIFDSTSSIRLAAVMAFWTDNRAFPNDTDQKLWWEVWVRSGNNQEEHDDAFQRFCLVAEGELQPFRNDNGTIKSNEMHIHSLPWPVEELQRLGAVDATVRITLSYFIEPSPGRRGWTNKFRYQSHGLRFKLRGPLEKEEVFRQRISRAFWDEEDGRPEGLGEPQSWALGRSGLTERGSIHCNWWKTSAAELADCGEVAVFPVGGWWKERKHLEKFNRRTRYALVISIETPDTTAELYTAIANKVAVQTQIST